MKKILVPAMLVLLLFTAGCDKPSGENPPAPSPEKQSAQSKSETVSNKKSESSKPPEVVSDSEKSFKSEENTPVEKNNSAQSMNVKVYYPDDSGMKLVEVNREIIVDDSTDKYTAAVETLLEEPREDNLTKIFPKSAAIRNVNVEDGLATVDFDGSLLKGFVGGSTGEEFLIGSVVDTLTNFPEVKQVKFLVDGKEIETLSGHMDLSTPLERMSDLTR